MSDYIDHDGLIVGPKKDVQVKLNNFNKASLQSMHLVFDFDRTLTVARPGTSKDITTWNIMREYLPQEGQVEYAQLFTKYRVLELAGTMTHDDATVWWTSILKLFVNHRLKLNLIEEDLLQRATIRDGVAELFEFCNKQAIPIVIISAGIRDVIEMWCTAYKVQPALILSTKLQTDDRGTITSYDEGTLVHALNKSEIGHLELDAVRNARPYVIAVGDSLNDADMANGEDTVLRIRMLDERADGATDQSEELERTFKRFDGAITNGSFEPIMNLLLKINAQHVN